MIALLSDYLAESRGWTEGIARSVATSHLIDRVAESRGLKLYETPVGFKFIGELINKDEIILGGEESAGLSIKGHYPGKRTVFWLVFWQPKRSPSEERV
jgi:phosphoglucomutase